jgi:prolyl-tRNA editing enzyme YbaK/EbsC (Cys-tRNA(Pro) deacylase)
MNPHYDIVANLTASGVRHVLHRHAAAHTMAEAEQLIPLDASCFLKTIVFKHKGGGYWLVTLRGRDAVDYKKLAAALGTKRELLSRPEPDEVLRELGYSFGSVAPFATMPGTQCLMDAAVMQLPVAYCGVADPTLTLEMDVPDLVAHTGARVADVAKPPPNTIAS